MILVNKSLSFDKSSLLGRVLSGSSWSVLGNLTGQLLRFGSNLLLTHLLFPKAFGLMALIQSILTAAHLISDVGLQQSMMRNPKAVEPDFFNTVWTLQIVKGFAVFGVMLLATPIAAACYHQPALLGMMPVMALTAVMGGFNSTKTVLLNRQLKVRNLVFLDLSTQVLSIVVMVLWARVSPSPWALVMGNLASSLVYLIASHRWLDGAQNRLRWDATVVQEVWSFGGWVMLSSTVTFLVNEGRNLLNASLVDPATLGLLTLATTLSLIIWNILQKICGQVLFPAYMEIWRERPNELSSIVAKSRRVQLLFGAIVATGFAISGQRVVGFFYDGRYQAAGEFLQILAVGSLFNFLTLSYFGVLWVMGRPRLATFLLFVQTAIMFICNVTGYWLGGVHGLVVGTACIGVLMYPVSALVYFRLRLFQPRIDAPILALGAVLAVYLHLQG